MTHIQPSTHASIPARHLVCLFLSVMLAALAGCQSNGNSQSQYKTVAGEGLRDTEAARQHNARGLTALQEEDIDTAEQAFKLALEADVMYGPAHNNLGRVFHSRKLYYKAAWEYQYAIKLMPHQPEPKYNLALIYESVGKLDDAIDLYSEAKTLEPDNPVLIGNVVRARVKRGDKDQEIRGLLTELLLKDTRPDWITWAKNKLAMMPVTTQ